MRYRPVGTREKRQGPPVYGPTSTGCPAVEQAIAALYREQNEESFWSLMNALNYAVQMETHVLVPLDAAPDPNGRPVLWAGHPVAAEKAKELPLWPLHTPKGRCYLPLFTSTRQAEREQSSALRPVTEMTLQEAMERALQDKKLDGIVLNPWGDSATLDAPLLNGLLHAAQDEYETGDEELAAGNKALREDRWSDAAQSFQEAADKGRAEGLTMMGWILYHYVNNAQSKAKARTFWKKAAEVGDVQAMLALGDDCVLSQKGDAAALRYYRRALKIGRKTPNISYNPRICLRIALTETQYISRKKALIQLAEALHGLRILAREGDDDARRQADQCQKQIDRLWAEGNEARAAGQNEL